MRHGRCSHHPNSEAEARRDQRCHRRLPGQDRAQYIVSHGFFKKGEIADICLRHLKADGELDTRQLAERVMCERKLEVSDTPLRNSVVFKVVQSLRHAERRRLVIMVEKRKGICVSSAADGLMLRVANSRSRSR